jgi:hypothetical protein
MQKSQKRRLLLGFCELSVKRTTPRSGTLERANDVRSGEAEMTTTHGSELVQTAKLISHGSVFFAALARVSRVRKRQKQRI